MSIEQLTATDIETALAAEAVQVSVFDFNFATAADEAVFMATASDDAVLAYASSIAYAANDEPDQDSAAKFAKNRGFLSGLMQKIWNVLKNPTSLLKIGAIAGSMALVGAALTLAVKNPAKFGAISKQFAAKASEWCSKVGQLAAKAVQAGQKSGGRIKTFILSRLAKAANVLKQLTGQLRAAAARGAQQAGNKAQELGRQAALRGGGAVHRAGKALQQGANRAGQAVQQGVRRAGNEAFKAGDKLTEHGSNVAQKAGQGLQRLSGQIHKHGGTLSRGIQQQGGNLARGIQKSGTRLAMQGIPG